MLPPFMVVRHAPRRNSACVIASFAQLIVFCLTGVIGKVAARAAQEVPKHALSLFSEWWQMEAKPVKADRHQALVTPNPAPLIVSWLCGVAGALVARLVEPAYRFENEK
jgi:hypothetical protein